ncbi:MAG: Gfo/Idh/MocA family oxidoreductase [Armatimonadota bacterium]|jgi:UDP-N-acetylglucosamine 3-dehydrogenase
MPFKVGLIGAGAISRAHVEAYVRSQRVDAMAVADPDEEARNGLAEPFGIIKETYATGGELLADDAIAVVDICTPHHLHHGQVMAALQAGKHVIVEKPLALTLQQADEMIAEARARDQRLFCALCQRMFPAHVRARELIDGGEIGKPFLGIVNVLGDEFARMNDADSWKGDREKAGGGALFDTGYHAIYMLQHFLGNATAVVASTRRLLVKPPNKADDTAVAALEMGEGRMGSVCVTYAATGTEWSEARFIVGTEGSLQILDGDEEMPLAGFQEKEFVPIPVDNPPDVNRYAIAQTLEHFLECIETGGEADITLPEARAALATALAAYESSRTGQRVEIAHQAEPKRRKR